MRRRDERLIPVKFATGVDSGKDPKQVSQALHQLENGVFAKEGTINKRHGIKALTGTIADADNLADRDGRPIRYGERIYTFNGTTPDAGSFEAAAKVTLLDRDLAHLRTRSGSVIMYPDIAAGANVIALSYCEKWEYASSTSPTPTTRYSLRLASIDRLTGALLAEQELWLLSTLLPHNAKVIDAGHPTLMHCLFVDASTKQIRYRTIDKTSGAIGAENVLSTLPAVSASNYAVAPGQNAFCFDACAIGGTNDSIGIGYISGTDDVTYATLATATAAEDFVTTTTTADRVGVFQWADGQCCILYKVSSAAQVRGAVFDDSPSTGPAIVADGLVLNGWAYASSGGWVHALTGINISPSLGYAYVSIADPTNTDPTVERVRIGVSGGAWAGPASAANIGQKLLLSSKPWRDASDNKFLLCMYKGWDGTGQLQRGDAALERFYVMLKEDSNDQVTFVGKAEPGTCGDSWFQRSSVDWLVGHLPEAAQLSATSWETPILRAMSVGTDGTATVGCLMATWELNFAPKAHYAQGLTILPGSSPWEFDGEAVFEQGFFQYPDGLFLQSSTNGANNVNTGWHGYLATYEWTDAQGNLHISLPSRVAAIELTGTEDTVAVYVPTLHVSNRPVDDVHIVIYRTPAIIYGGSGTPGGSSFVGPFYRVLETKNDSTQDYMYLEDTQSDDAIDQNRIIYSDGYNAGQVLENEPPHAYRTALVFKGRVFYVRRDAESTQVFYSKKFVGDTEARLGLGSEPPTFNEVMALNVPHEGGRITALEAIGEKLIVFKERAIYATSGPGLTDSGSGSGYLEPYIVNSGIGCADEKTIVRTPIGLMFLSNTGIFALTKQLTIKPVGKRVEYWTDTLTITGANVISDKHYAVWTTSDGLALVYNYLYDEWSTFTNHESLSAVESQGLLYLVKSDGICYVEDRTAFTDDAAAVTLLLVTGWFSFSGVAGFLRWRRGIFVGQNISNHRLQIKTGFDYDPVWTDDQTFATDVDIGNTYSFAPFFGAGLAAGFADKAYLVEFAGSRQKVSAVRFELRDLGPTAGGAQAEALSISGLGLIVKQRESAKRLGDARVL